MRGLPTTAAAPAAVGAPNGLSLCKAHLTLLACQGSFTPVLNHVRARRTERGLSQASLAAAMEVSRQTINAIETGRYLPSLPLAFALARYFDVAAEELFDPSAEGPTP